MANTDQPWGLQPLFMAEAQRTALLFPIENNYGTALFINDPVVGITTGSRINRATAGDGNDILGTILGIYRQETPKSIRVEKLLPVQYFAASPGTTYEYFALVACDTNLYFTMQEDGAVTPLTIDSSFGNVNLVYTHTGNTVTGISKAEIDSDSLATTATYQIKLVKPWYDYWDITANAYNVVGAYCKWIVKINDHQLANATAGLA